MKLIFIILLALPLISAASGLTNLKSALTSLCSGLTSMLPVAAMLMTLLAAVIYASGQMMGAETRARANVWATAALTGAMMAVLITIIAQPVLGTVYGDEIKCQLDGIQTVLTGPGTGAVCPPEGCICGCSGVIPVPPTVTCTAGQNCGCTNAPGAHPTCI